MLLSNVTNYQRLADNFLGVAEPESRYELSDLSDLERKLALLNKKEAREFLKEINKQLDSLIATKNPG